MLRFLALLAAMLLLAAPLRADEPPARGELIVIGGAWRSDEETIWQRIESRRIPGRPLGVFGTASATPESSAQSFVNTYTGKFGPGTAIAIDITQSNNQADNPAVADAIRACGGFFFTGGDQQRVVSAFVRSNGSNTLALDAVWEVNNEGGPIAGSSAGAAIMSDPMIRGGTSAGAVANGWHTGTGSGVRIGRGLGFVPGVMFDQHHLERGRLGRLVIATEGAGFDLGIGVDENSAIAVDPATGWGDVLGEMGVFVVDISGMHAGPGRVRHGIRLSYLDFGDRIHLETREVVPSPTKVPITFELNPPQPIESSNIWAPYEAWRVATLVADTAGSQVGVGADPSYDILFRQTPDTRVWRGPFHTYRNNRRAYLVDQLELGFFPRGGSFPEPSHPASFILY